MDCANENGCLQNVYLNGFLYHVRDHVHRNSGNDHQLSGNESVLEHEKLTHSHANGNGNGDL